MYFICTKCKNKVFIPRKDLPRYEKHDMECDLCYTLISAGRYEKNIPGGLTLFSFLGDALGDKIMQSSLRRYYVDQNPDEEVIFAESKKEFTDYFFSRKWNKVFWSDITNQIIEVKGLPWFAVTNEAKALSKMGYWPELPEKPEKPNDFDLTDFVVVHLRNFNTCEFKNFTQQEAFNVLSYLNVILDYDIVLVDNDEPFKNDISFVTKDYRKVLSLGEIGWLLINAKLFIGKDAGIAHMAAAAQCRSVVWGFQSIRWNPLNRVESIYLMEKESGIENIKNSINKLLEYKNVA